MTPRKKSETVRALAVRHHRQLITDAALKAGLVGITAKQAAALIDRTPRQAALYLHDLAADRLIEQAPEMEGQPNRWGAPGIYAHIAAQIAQRRALQAAIKAERVARQKRFAESKRRRATDAKWADMPPSVTIIRADRVPIEHLQGPCSVFAFGRTCS